MADRRPPFRTEIDPLEKIIQVNGVHFRVVGVSSKRGSILGRSRTISRSSRSDSSDDFRTRGALSLTVKPRDLSLIAQAQDGAIALREARRLKPKQPDNFGMFTSEHLSRYLSFRDQRHLRRAGRRRRAVARRRRHRHHEHHADGGHERTREIGLTQGARSRRSDIVAQMLTESVLLSIFGGWSARRSDRPSR
jgi:hypothetical protein